MEELSMGHLKKCLRNQVRKGRVKRNADGSFPLYVSNLVDEFIRRGAYAPLCVILGGVTAAVTGGGSNG